MVGEANDAAAARLLPSPRGSVWRWEDDELTRELVRELQSGEAHETRAFLRPIFKWMKGGVRKNGQKNDDLVERAFAFVDWMVQLAHEGDTARAIPALAKLQPSYALNTIVTSSQRAGSLAEAKRAFELIEFYGYEPDVFTYTALIDVTARSGDVKRAIAIYEAMRATRSRPNIVTFTTIIRAVAFTTGVPAIECLRFLAHAREEETFDEALYLDALETCATRQAMIAASAVLREITQKDVTLRNSERLVLAIAKLVEKRDDKETLLSEWLQDGIVTQHEVGQIGVATKATSSRVDGPKSLGALGNQTSDSVRLAVVQHDISRLTERIANGSMVSTNDFETLIHQCRKRKWKEEVDLIVQAMRKLATDGWEIPSGLDGTAPIVLPAQPHLMPSSKTFVSVVDSYLVAGDEPLAWKAFQEVGAREELVREQALYRKYVRGCYLLTDCTHIEEMLQLALADGGIVFTNRMCLELARMHGYRHQEGIDVVLRQIPLSTRERKQQYMEELVTSCAYKHNTQGVVDTIEVLPAHGLSRSDKTEMAVFICCLQHEYHSEASEMMQSFQKKRLLLDIPMYDSLLREMYFKYTRRGGVFDDSSRGVAMRTLQMRKSLFDAAFRERDALEDWAKSTYHIEYRAKSSAWREDNDQETDVPCPMKYWCQLHALECAPLMFTQHVVETVTTIRDKESKIAKQQLIREALESTPDPFLFNLRAVSSLRALDLTYRGQGKLSKQMLTILSETEPQPHHVEYCLNELNVLTVHIVKELDDVMQLHRHNQQRILDFCMDALETENVDKTIGYLISREALYTVDTARFFTPKFAELYVLHGVVTILQFFKPDVEHSTDMKRHFLREVIDVESLTDDDSDASGMPLTRRAIFEFKLEHDSEFMPIIMMPPSERQFAPATATAVDESLFLQLPLPESQVVIVDQDESLAVAYDIMMQPSIHRIGIDAEWRPDARGYAQSKCSLLQIACDTHVFLFDLMELSIIDLEELFSHLFSSPSIVKLGFALDGDIKRLQWSFPDVTCFSVVENVLDFNHDELPGEAVHATGEADEEKLQNEAMRAAKKRRRHRGLSAFAQEILGAPLNKTQQKSDWEKRPLSPQQIKYAALDAYCLLMLHDCVSQQHQQQQQQAQSGDEAI